jgi:hypothetical protein
MIPKPFLNTNIIKQSQAKLKIFQKWMYHFWVSGVFYAFPTQLLMHNIKKNQVLLLLWGVILGMITESFGTMIGLPTLFLDPEYINQVNFWSFFLMGFTLGVFSISFHMVCYILDVPQFSFVGNMPRPFTKFYINNSVLPFVVIVIYFYKVIDYQASYAHTTQQVVERVSGLAVGLVSAFTLIYGYFVSTNQDIFKIVALQVNKRLRKSKVVRINLLSRLKTTRRKDIRVDYLLDGFFRICKVPHTVPSNNQTIIKVFNQNHLNGVIIQMAIFVLVLLIGTLRDYPYFQLPAGASLLLLFTILLMFTGALSYWLRGWAGTATIILLVLLNYFMKFEWITAKYEAYGLDYQIERAEYSLKRVKEMSNDEFYALDYKTTLIALDNWKKKFTDENPTAKPKMIFLCASGGGQRAAVWTMRTLQYVDSTLNGDLMKHSTLITGASGGLIGGAYYRELCLRKELYRQKILKKPINPFSEKYLENIGKDNLNAIVFSLVVNDLFFNFQTFDSGGYQYAKDRGFAFEQQLNLNTEGILDKPLCDYKEPEMLGMIPMMILAPTIVNDGRKLFISPLNVSYMTVPRIDEVRFLNQKTKGIEFLRFFEKQNAPNLRFLSALRMSATFPYITPNVRLPSQPEMEIMDAGLSDNFGVSDAVRFLYAFRKWIEQNTSGVIFVSIRDTQKDKPIERSIEQSLLQKIFTPVASLYGNLEYLQDIANDNMIEFAQSWFNKGFGIHRIEFQYVPVSKNMQEIEQKTQDYWNHKQDNKNLYKVIKIDRAALSWRLTQKEKESIKRTIFELRNQLALSHLERLLEK